MPLHTLSHSNGRTLAIWKMDEEVVDLLKMVSISDESKSQLLALSRENRQKERLVALYLAQKFSGVDTQVCYKPNGAPYLIASHLNISITHSKEWLAMQVSSLFEVGLDMEYKSDRIVKIAHKFMAESEISFVEEQQMVDYLNIIWCAKETLYKIAQIEGAIFTENFIIEPFDIGLKGSIVGNVVVGNSSTTHRLGYEINDNWYLVYKE